MGNQIIGDPDSQNGGKLVPAIQKHSKINTSQWIQNWTTTEAENEYLLLAGRLSGNLLALTL